MRAEKSHVLSSTSWGSKKAGAVISVWVWRPENPGSRWCKSQSESMWRLMSSWSFLLDSGHQRIEGYTPTLGRAAYFIESSNSNADLTWKCSQWHTQKYGLVWTSYDIAKLKQNTITELYSSRLKIWKCMMSPLLRNWDDMKPDYLKLENLHLYRFWE